MKDLCYISSFSAQRAMSGIRNIRRRLASASSNVAMHIVVVGLDHHTSPVEVRERFAFRPSQMEPAYSGLLRPSGTPVHEAAILSTCNRVEVYAATATPDEAQD